MIGIDYKKIESLAADKEMSIGDLAKVLRYKSPTSLYNLKYSGQARVKTAARIAKALGVDLKDIRRVRAVKTVAKAKRRVVGASRKAA